MFVDPSKSDNASSKSTDLKIPARVRKVHGRHVLLVASSVDAVSVLKTILGRRGVTTTVTLNADEGLRLALTETPNIIVLDSDVVPTPALSIEYAAVADEIRSEMIVLGRLQGFGSGPRRWAEVEKPYHFESLIRNIESRLRDRLAA